MKQKTYLAVGLVVFILGIFYVSLAFADIRIQETEGFKALIAESVILMAVSAALIAQDHPTPLSWKQRFPFYVLIPMGIGGSMVLYLSVSPLASYVCALLSVVLISLIGMWLDHIENTSSEALVKR